MLKSILVPALIASLIVIPLIYQKSTSAPQPQPSQSGWNGAQTVSSQQNIGQPGALSQQTRTIQPAQSEMYGGTVPPQSIFHAPPPQNPASMPAMAKVKQVAAPSAPAAKPFSLPALRTPAQHTSGSVAPVIPVASPSQLPSAVSATSGIPLAVIPEGANVAFSGTPDITGMTPDFGKAETTIYRGTAAGPDLTSQPLSFLPVNDFREVFRFDINESWVKQRFERISTVPADAGLHGMRTAMVTGTNSWDLHGSQTYYFDKNHRLQRITFRGWVGDSNRLLEMATKHFGLKPQPTHWAGLYTGEFGGKLTGGLIMKDPDVIDHRNQLQRIAVLLELNQPSGSFKISDDFRGLLKSAAGK